MTNNQEGNIIITVLLVSLIFSVLGLTIVAASISSNQRTGVRIDDIEITAEATKNLNQAIAVFTTEARSISLSEYELANGSFDSRFDSIINKIKDNRLIIEDITENEVFGNVDRRLHFTRIFKFTYTVKNEDGANITKTISRTVYLAPTPSFLKYAMGSGPDGQVKLNGAAEIVGDLLTGTLLTDDTAYFIDNNSSYDQNGKLLPTEHPTLFPRFGDNGYISNLYVTSNINGVQNFETITTNIDHYFDKESKLILINDTTDFIDVDFENTLAQLFNKISGSYDFSEEMFNNAATAETAIEKLISYTSNVKVIDFNTLNSQTPAYPKAFVYRSDKADPVPYILQGSIKPEILANSWFIVQGDLQVPAGTKIPGNIIVTGDLYIEGNDYDSANNPESIEDDDVYFDSTIYVLGESHITNTNIKGLEDYHKNAKLILMSKGNIYINRINEFNSVNADIKEMDAFFYTDSEAELYGVGSLFRINGGLFARNRLEVNAIRQDKIKKSSNLLTEIVSVSEQQNQHSRFYVKYDKSVLLDPNRLDSLPRVDRYQILLDKRIIKNGID